MGARKEVTAELNFLSTLIAPAKQSDAFKLNLFGEKDGKAAAAPADPASQMITISKVSREEMEKMNRDLVAIMKEVDVKDAGGKEEDLLDLLDAAG
eukprot:NODE_2725_length_550_cov_31.023952_g2343_i0.p3 GENE.NODE_2725_length_550_cov_31.023952_g2343_i0~~NODE_2725_length_550_cov_31.023952_g2343_i0.p3  ORF type:complete len:103 (-),score=60.41 NODE_2725_length_550_cov_31.023952_g2343_i0:240-527(-)